jgi:thiol-disulfide isomerase/thioredoxin
MPTLTQTGRLALGVISLLLNVTFPAQGRQAQAVRRHRGTQGRRVAVKPVAAARVIVAEELPALLKRNGTRPLLVNYWATWCDPCREEFPDLVRVDHDYRARGLDTIAISLDDLAELKTEVPKFLLLMKARMPVYLLNVADPEPSIRMVDATWSGALPATFLYDPAGEIVFKKFGRFDTAELRVAIEKLVGTRQEQKAVSGK